MGDSRELCKYIFGNSPHSFRCLESLPSTCERREGRSLRRGWRSSCPDPEVGRRAILRKPAVCPESDQRELLSSLLGVGRAASPPLTQGRLPQDFRLPCCCEPPTILGSCYDLLEHSSRVEPTYPSTRYPLRRATGDRAEALSLSCFL